MTDSNNVLSLSGSNLICDIQAALSRLYPFLKIDFLGTDHQSKELKSAIIDPGTSLKQFARIDDHHKISISSNRTVLEVSHDFEHMLGVIVQMSRRSGNVWSMISVTDGWTLESQNTAGEFISSEMANPTFK